MINELDPVELIRKAKYAFRGTDKAFYQRLLMHSKRIFGKSGLYSGLSRGGKQTISVTLDPAYALSYARRANKVALDCCEEFLRSHYGIKNFGPIVLLIDIEKYKDRISEGLELEHGFEYEILGPINEEDIQILDDDHINNLELYCMKDVLASGAHEGSLIFPGMVPSNLEQVLTNVKEGLRKFLVKNSNTSV